MGIQLLTPTPLCPCVSPVLPRALLHRFIDEGGSLDFGRGDPIPTLKFSSCWLALKRSLQPGPQKRAVGLGYHPTRENLTPEMGKTRGLGAQRASRICLALGEAKFEACAPALLNRMCKRTRGCPGWGQRGGGKVCQAPCSSVCPRGAVLPKITILLCCLQPLTETDSPGSLPSFS